MPAAADAILAEPDELSRVPIRVVIADDHPLIRASIRRAIAQVHDIAVVGEARSGSELIELIERRMPDVVLMDMSMPGMTGVEVMKRLRWRWPRIRMVALSACDECSAIDAALHAGASAYVVKGAHAVDIASVLRGAVGIEHAIR